MSFFTTVKLTSRVLLTLAFGLMACETSHGPVPKETGVSAATRTASTTRARTSKASGSGSGPQSMTDLEIAPADHTALLATLRGWLHAQNQGDFAAYEQLYSQSFTGIKRSDSRVFRADREDWLKDRREMFSRPTTVKAEEVVVSGGGSGARIRFVQDFRTPTFQDRGPKELQLLKVGKSWQIVREEMLSSVSRGPDTTSKRIPPGDFSFVRQVPDGTLILLDRYANLGPIHGTPKHVRDGVVLRPVRQELVEERYRVLVGQRFRVYAADGSTCDVIPDHLTIYGESLPHFGTLAAWHGEGQEHRVFSESERALESWRMIGDDRWLALASKHVCAGGWARLAAAKAPVLYSAAANDASLESAALASLAATEKHASMQSWANENLENAAPRTGTRLFEGPGGDQYIAAFAEFGVGFCSEYSGRHLGIFRRTDQGVSPMTDLTAGYSAGPLGRTYDVVRERGVPSSAVDLDHDGNPEFVFDQVLFGFTGSRYEIVREARIPDYDCHC